MLGVAPDSLAYLEAVHTDELRALRDQVIDVMFNVNRRQLKNIAAASRVVPGALSAKIAERALGPLLCARVAGIVDAARAVDIAKRLPPAFLADVAVELDPRRATDVITRIPAARIAEVTSELARRGETVTMGRFVGRLGDDALRAAVDRLDDEALLQIAFVIEDKDRLDHVVSMLAHERLTGIVRAAAEAGLWPEALDFLSHLGPEQFDRIVAAAPAAGIEEHVPEIRRAAEATRLEETGRDLLARLEEGRLRGASRPTG